MILLKGSNYGTLYNCSVQRLRGGQFLATATEEFYELLEDTLRRLRENQDDEVIVETLFPRLVRRAETDVQKHETYTAWGKALAMQQRWEAATEVFYKAFAHAPSAYRAGEVRMHQAQLCYWMGDLDQALDMLRDASERLKNYTASTALVHAEWLMGEVQWELDHPNPSMLESFKRRLSRAVYNLARAEVE